ncbi:hypothetical protein Q9L58_005761 [Maublancomyces gigas]|uniref:Uncharacterized protein n=1 Tax=Discina gigas TaxID=1032678 RepID=A0ABR3GI78_9PEZI
MSEPGGKSYSIVWIDRQIVVIEKRVNAIVEQHPILDGVDRPSNIRRNHVGSLEAPPDAILSTESWLSRYNASTISFTDSITERCDTGPTGHRDCTNQPRLIVDGDGAYWNQQQQLNDVSVEEPYYS